VKQVSIGSAYQFQPRQIVFLEHEDTRLYTEVIEVVKSRQVCWVRPLMLAVPKAGDNPQPLVPPEQVTLYDLRQGADLLWPASLFRPALDTEVIPLLAQLNDPDAQLLHNSDAHNQLSCFVRQVWQAYKSAF
jgi:hypothetical protein